MHTVGLPQSQPKSLGVSCTWVVKENGKEVLRKKNVFTDYGLTALASAPTGVYVAPTYLVIDQNAATVTVQGNPGDTHITVSGPVDLSGDTQLVLSVGQGSQEVVTFSSYSAGVYTLSSALVNTHLVGEFVIRQVLHTDLLATIINELQYDPTNNPGLRLALTSTYSSGAGVNTMQFYFTSTMGIGNFISLGLADSQAIGTGNLHNHVTLGYVHSSGNDLEIDVVLTLINA